MSRAVLSLGSNLGDRFGYLRDAVAGLGERVAVVSGVYETPPWPPGERAPAYLNAVVVAVEPGADGYRWLELARERERAAGRVRDPARRYSPRTLDVDVIAVVDDRGGPVIFDHPELTLPHPRAHLRAFVLRPWLDAEPYAVLPGHGPVGELLRSGPAAAEVPDLRPRPDLRLESGS